MKKIIFISVISLFCSVLFAYDYDVSGNDETGNLVNGHIYAYGDSVHGSITDENGNEKDISGHWYGRGNITAEDDEGNSYELETE